MRHKRLAILAGVLAGIGWALALLALGARIPVPIGLIQPVLLGAFFGPGCVLVLMIGRLAQRRFFDNDTIDGEAFSPGSPGEIDQRVLTNTVEQTLLALCIWPLVGFFVGAGTLVALSAGFVVARLLFWIGYHISPPLRALGFAATFYPTVAAALLVLYRLAV